MVVWDVFVNVDVHSLGSCGWFVCFVKSCNLRVYLVGSRLDGGIWVEEGGGR